MDLTRIGGPEYASKARPTVRQRPTLRKYPPWTGVANIRPGLKRRLSKPGTSDGRIARFSLLWPNIAVIS